MDKTDNMDKMKQRMLDAAEAMYEFDPCERSEIWCERIEQSENTIKGVKDSLTTADI